MDVTEIPARVRTLLDHHSESQTELAKHLSIDETRLSKSLSGRRAFTSLDLAEIAEHFGTTVDWLLGLEERRAALAARSSSGVGLSSAIDLAEEFAEVRGVLSTLGFAHAVPDIGRGGSGLWYEQGEQMAQLALALLNEGDSHVGASTAQLCSLVEQAFGVDVAIENVPSGCDGLTWRDETSALIVVAASENLARQRFTLAHELCHALSEDDQGLHVDENIFDPQRKKQPSEVRANAFAASFLMPVDVLTGFAETKPVGVREHFAELAFKLLVSPSSLSWRLLNLGLIVDTERVSLGSMSLADCARTIGRAEDLQQLIAFSSSPRPPVALLADALAAYEGEKTSLRMFARVARRPVDQVRAALDALDDGDNPRDAA
ncbi:ImmA/IrrE family metallo-endopeptidase [Aeromicrobium sp. Leaf350]|uniref:helix-turn-helix domain-containing protein n=1 Tax=Aeromicrobium sp. Leaf350 TaxID=2876565 RepID=UPI001E5EDD2F|nr:XRE family transcriptional regulator [Aeromicrobium sp. Leaf350]